VGSLRRRLDALERRARDGGGPDPVWVIVCEGGEPREVWAAYGWATKDGGHCVALGEGETVEDAIAQFLPLDAAHSPELKTAKTRARGARQSR